ncbi:unnamed protein product [Camellia sinensis]
MDRLRPRDRKVFSGFTTAEIEKMEKLRKDSMEQSLDPEFCKRLARSFNCSKGRVGKPSVKWTEVQSWFQDKQQAYPLKDASSPIPPEKLSVVPVVCPLNKADEKPQASKVFLLISVPRLATAGPEFSVKGFTCCLLVSGEAFRISGKWIGYRQFLINVVSKTGDKVPDLSELEFEARSSKDGAWYDVDMFLNHRFLSSGEAEVHVRFIGFGSEEDEWVNVKKAIRERSLPLEHSECGKLKVGDLVLCFQERRDQARYYDAHVVEIQRRMHDIRGCRCLFLIRYDHDNTEARESSFEKIMLPANILDQSSDSQIILCTQVGYV